MNIKIASSSDKHKIAELFKKIVEFYSQKDPIFTLKASGTSIMQYGSSNRLKMTPLYRWLRNMIA
jgi:hypothetical protein